MPIYQVLMPLKYQVTILLYVVSGTTTKCLYSDVDGGGPTVTMSILWSVATVDPHWCRWTVRRCCDPSNERMWHHIFAHYYCDHLIVAMSDHVMSHDLIAGSQQRRAFGDIIWPITTKGHCSRAVRLVSPRLQKVGLTNISTCLQYDLRAASMDTGEINFLYPLASSFIICRI
jgi:hypothetical protein